MAGGRDRHRERDADPGALSDAERVGLQRFLALGGTLFVDDFEPSSAAFTRGVRRELGRVVPEALPVRLSDKSVLWKSFYLLSRPYGRVEGPSSIDAVLRGGLPQILFSSHDLLGALASGPGSGLRVEPGGETQRERAVRFAVNIAMFVLCSNYKDDQVHAPFLMRRRKPESP